MFSRRHHHHHEESYGALTATIGERRPSSSTSVHEEHFSDPTELFSASKLEAAGTSTTSLWKSSALVKVEEVSQKLRQIEPMVTSDLSGRKKQLGLQSQRVNTSHCLKTTRSFQLVRSDSEPIFLQKDSQQAENNRRRRRRRSTCEVKLSEPHGHRFGNQDLAGSSKSPDECDVKLSHYRPRHAIVLWRSVRSLGYFWIDFVRYQLETWRQLADHVSSTATHARGTSASQHQENHKMSSSKRQSCRQPDSNQRQRPLIGAANRSQSEAAHYYAPEAIPQAELNPPQTNKRYQVSANLYLSDFNEANPPPPPMPTVQPHHYGDLIYGSHFKQEQLRHPQITKMNTMDGSPVAASYRRRTPLVSQRTLDSSTPSSYTAQMLADQFSASSSSGSQLAFYAGYPPPAADFHVADKLHHLYSVAQQHYHHHPPPSPPPANFRWAPVVATNHYGIIDGENQQQPSTSRLTTTNFSSSTNNPSVYSQSFLQQQVHNAQPRQRATTNRATAISSDSELNFQQRRQINFDGQQVAANKGQWQSRNECPSGARARPLCRQSSAVPASSASAQQQQQQEFATNLNARNQQRNATFSARNSKKSSNLVKLSLEGAKRRLGFKQEGGRISQLSIQRSEEVLPLDSNLERLQDLTISSSLADVNLSHCSSPFHWSLTGSGASRSPFIEGLGLGQVYSRQALVSPDIGDLMLTLCNRHGALEITVIKARRLHLKLGTTQKPSPYVKIYLIKDKKCIAKWKTLQALRTLEPEYRESFIYRGDFSNCAAQIIVWGDYGRKDRKSFMGIVQICTDNLELSSTITGWYKLFNAPSMINLFNSSKQMRQQILPK